MLRTVKLFRPSRFLGTMASADFSQFVVTTDRAPSVRPHGISPEPFPVYSPDLRIEVTVAFWTLMRLAILSVQYALVSGFCPSSHGFAIASSRLYLTVQTLQVALRFVGNYAPQDFHPRFGTCPSYNKRVCSFLQTLIGGNRWIRTTEKCPHREASKTRHFKSHTFLTCRELQ